MNMRQLLIDLILANAAFLAIMYLLTGCATKPDDKYLFQSFHRGCMEGMHVMYMITQKQPMNVQQTLYSADACGELWHAQ